MITLFTGYDEEPKDKKPAEAEEAESEQKSGFFSRMRQAVTRTRESLSSRVNEIVALTREVDEAALEELESALITCDIGVQTTTEILDALRERARLKAIEGGEELRDLLKEQLRGILEAPRRPVVEPADAAEGDVSGGRERHRKDDYQRQAGGVVSRAGKVGAAVRCRHVSRGGD